MRTVSSNLMARAKNGPAKKWAAGLPRPKFREETPRRRTVEPQPVIVTALHNLGRCARKSSFFFQTRWHGWGIAVRSGPYGTLHDGRMCNAQRRFSDGWRIAGATA